ncbi:MAG: hypothetical protein Kow0042_12670 [Calditrichia bacterium]
MKKSKANSKESVRESTPRPGCSGKVGLILTLFVDFCRHISKALESLPYEYESPRKFLGLPLLSINLGFDNPQGKMRYARGIIAIGNKATGIIAFGIFVARVFFSISIIAYGVVSVSIVGLALLSVGVFGVGVVSVSVVAVGYLAVGIFALGYKSVGIVAVGHDVVGIITMGQKIRSAFTP